MKKIRSAEYLVAIAIVTSATVLQIREHMQVHEALPATPQAAQMSCETTHGGLVPAACEPTRSEVPADGNRVTRHQRVAPNIWV